MKTMILVILTAAITNNYVLVKFLGICPFLGVSKKLDQATGMSLAVIFVEVLATAGNNHLGGDDFDQCIVDYLVREFKNETKVDLSRDPAAMQRLREAAEKAKIELSSMTQTTVEQPYIAVGKQGPLHMEIPLTRAKFNDLTYHLVQATREPVNQAINDSGISISQISKVLMVGGSSRIPAVQDLSLIHI